MKLRTFSCAVAMACALFALTIPAAEANGRHHRAPTAASHSLVATINAKLRRFVRPTGSCPSGYSERLATFYWQGRRTANGEHFNPDGLTAAHMRLAFGTRLHITNPHNGRSTAVRINDRGPATIAWIDLSRGAARALGLRQSSYICVSGA